MAAGVVSTASSADAVAASSAAGAASAAGASAPSADAAASAAGSRRRRRRRQPHRRRQPRRREPRRDSLGGRRVGGRRVGAGFGHRGGFGRRGVGLRRGHGRGLGRVEGVVGRDDGCVVRGLGGWLGGGLVGDGYGRRGRCRRLGVVRGDRLGLRRGPALLIFGQVLCLSCSHVVPGNADGLGSAQASVRNDEMMVRGDWPAVLSPSRESGWTCLQLGCLPEPGESSTAFLAATIARPCPNCPTSRSSPRRSEPPSWAAPSPRPLRPGRSPCAVRRPSSTPSSGSASSTFSGGASSCSWSSIPIASSSARC